jgi:hypothetical protein
MEELKINHPAGAPIVEVSEDELIRVYGGGDVQPETAPVVTGLTIITLYVPSKLNC